MLLPRRQNGSFSRSRTRKAPHLRGWPLTKLTPWVTSFLSKQETAAAPAITHSLLQYVNIYRLPSSTERRCQIWKSVFLPQTAAVLPTPPWCLTNRSLLRISVSPYKDLQRRNKNRKLFFAIVLLPFIYIWNAECARQTLRSDSRQLTRKELHSSWNAARWITIICLWRKSESISVCILLQKPVPLDLLNVHF